MRPLPTWTMTGAMLMTVRQTAVREQLGDFAPAFARINDDVLFGEVRSRTEALGLRDRSS